jgi:heme exporter protein A
MVLKVSDLAVSRGGVLVLEGLNFTLKRGNALILRGPNGSGKTTLLRTLAGLQPAVAGRIEAEQDDIAFATHSDGLKPTLTVRENLTFWAHIFGSNHIDETVDAFALQSLLNRSADALSAGQKRRLGLARLMISGRPLWILDEPTVSLDKESVARFAETVKLHLSKGGAALLATHIDLGIEADVFDVSPFKAKPTDLPFLDEVML